MKWGNNLAGILVRVGNAISGDGCVRVYSSGQTGAAEQEGLVFPAVFVHVGKLN